MTTQPAGVTDRRHLHCNILPEIEPGGRSSRELKLSIKLLIIMIIIFVY